jgi:hypothetical protein
MVTYILVLTLLWASIWIGVTAWFAKKGDETARVRLRLLTSRHVAVIITLLVSTIVWLAWKKHSAEKWIEGPFWVTIKSADVKNLEIQRYRWRGRVLWIQAKKGDTEVIEAEIQVPATATYSISGVPR